MPKRNQASRAPDDGRGGTVTPFLAGIGADALPDAVRAAARPLPPVAVAALVVLLDLIAIGGAGLLADALVNNPGARHAGMTGLLAGLAVAFAGAIGAYDHAALHRAGPQRARALQGLAAALLVLLLVAVTLGAQRRIDPAWLGTAALLAGACLLAARTAVAALLRQDGSRSAQRAVILGAGPQATRLTEAMRRNGGSGLRLLGLVDDRGARGADALPDGLRRLGGMAQLAALIRAGQVDVVVLALPWSAEARIAAALDQLSAYPVEIRLAPDLLMDRLPASRRPAGPVLLRARPISGLGAAVKVAEDYAMAILALAIAAVPMLLIALAIKLDSPGPVFFRQRRTGFNDQPFDVLKFRTMYAEATDHEVLRQVRAGDARVTPVGAILRKTSLDELPQIFNILKGDMSFVGPRPHAPGTRAAGRRFDEVVANYAARHQVKPGLTGLAQVRGWRGPTITEEQIIRRVESDLEYIERWSPWLDITIILRTLLAVACMRNAL
ncbi:exopolysaccharide biosynthesis polyprenyl glycosylphosphotransferase [Falsiroseomonas ponticola]|uniref:exopolysaccharide biosynthesis polyprenyl glycosylphosphotransferase n=1 Tax=Falsiroseomonas ponticola TaxID=2786951 RepID=UPI0019329EA7|nr:exopolysaccharide biosynthesis polyprenyl glycosylphosphotransferase [Roseomonas ponticola]